MTIKFLEFGVRRTAVRLPDGPFVDFTVADDDKRALIRPQTLGGQGQSERQPKDHASQRARSGFQPRHVYVGLAHSAASRHENSRPSRHPSARFV